MRIAVLASGSGGNALVISTAQSMLLVDAGLAPREVRRRLGMLEVAATGWQPAHLAALLITHEHGDHGKFALSYKKLGVPLWSTAGTALSLDVAVNLLSGGCKLNIAHLTVTPVELSHDAVEPVGYIFEEQGAKLGVLTDAGWDDPALARCYAGCQVLVLESNHDETMLQNGSYPAGLKRRIAGPRGHLSNQQSASLLSAIIKLGGAPRVVVLAHLSRKNNRPELARLAARQVLGPKPHLIVAKPGAPTPWISLSSTGEVSIDRGQLDFAFMSQAEVNQDES